MANWITDPDREHGEVFTKPWVVELILDTVGYDPATDLAGRVIVEPSCGYGAFLVPIIERLARSCEAHGRRLADCGEAIRAFDILDHNAEQSRKEALAKLLELGQPLHIAETLSSEWVRAADFLEAFSEPLDADFVVGNPPYIRLEDLPPNISDAYRAEFETMRGRADIYVGFFEKGLRLLKSGGRLGFICADRWMRNQYGEGLRALVTSEFAVDSVIVMHDVDAFENSVSAYPAITILRNGKQGTARVVDAAASFDQSSGNTITAWIRGRSLPPANGSFEAAELPSWFEGSMHWPSGSPRQLELLAELERKFRPLQDRATGTRVGIGVATGCDSIYIAERDVGIEEDRLLPLLTAGDIATGAALWSGKYLVNPWTDQGLVALADYPNLGRYFRRHESRLRNRHVAKRQPHAWFRTIDRVAAGLKDRPKLLLPDIKAAAHPVLDPGGYYPHHNLYYVVSEDWDLEVLGGLLLSDFANLFVGAYCVKMRGGTYRFQAQYLRKIRVPDPTTLDERVQDELRNAFVSRDRSWATDAAGRAYGLAPDVLKAIGTQ